VGVTKHCVSLVDELVFVDVSAKPNYNVDASDEVGTVEGKDKVRDVLSPVAGQVVITNKDVTEDPSRVDEGDEGWPFRIKVKSTAEADKLMNEDEYKKFCKAEG
jgi:glycine cleavage system H protein